MVRYYVSGPPISRLNISPDRSPAHRGSSERFPADPWPTVAAEPDRVVVQQRMTFPRPGFILVGNGGMGNRYEINFLSFETHGKFELFRAGLLPDVVVAEAKARVIGATDDPKTAAGWTAESLARVGQPGTKGQFRAIEVTVRVENRGALATHLAQGVSNPGNREDLAWLTAEGAHLRIVSGGSPARLGVLEGSMPRLQRARGRSDAGSVRSHTRAALAGRRRGRHGAQKRRLVPDLSLSLPVKSPTACLILPLLLSVISPMLVLQSVTIRPRVSWTRTSPSDAVAAPR
jgi:hypothetical protein